MIVLVTGGAGFIGSHLVEHFQGSATVRVLDNLRTGAKTNLAGLAHEFIEGSVTDRAAVREAIVGVDYVFHLAAFVSVPESMEKPVECVEINTTGTLIVLEEAARAGVKKLCFSSSAAIYADDPAMPKIETMAPAPRSPYAMTKLDGEYYCAMFQEADLLETVALRYFNVFGPRQDPRGAYAAAVPIFIERALAHLPITIFGDGLQTRDFISVRDVVAANVHCATQSGLRGCYNVARGGQMTINDLASKIRALTDSRSEIVHLPTRVGDVKHSTADIEKLRASGFEPEADFEEALAATVKWFARRS
ncbi:MAG: NAD-dependent epimerase/dehydratase family protein [Chthoniobacterales bacterium]